MGSILQLGVFLLICIWLTPRHVALGLVAYDCADEYINITAISLRKVAECPEPGSAYKSETVDVRVVQRTEIGLQRVWTCLIEVSRLITYCGMHSHSSVVSGGLLNYIHRVGAEECRMVHRYRTLKLYQQTIGEITLNGTTTSSITLHGSLDNSGRCDGVTYQENGNTWTNVVIIATVKIQVMDYFAMVKLNDNEISLKGGVTCSFLESYCFDSTLGESTWDYKSPLTCENQLGLIYEGKAEKITNKISGEQYIVVDKGTKIFAVTLVKRMILCNLEFWQSEHPRLLIAEGNNLKFQLTTAILPQDTDLMLYINSKFLYVEQSYKRALHTLYVDTIHRRCLVQREILRNRLLMAPISPDAVSQIIKEKEGYIGRVLGEVLYILRCIPKQVSIRRTNRCYQELPVEVNNQSKFMSPGTRILQDHGEEIDCNSLTPPLYYIDGEWIGLVPQPTVRRPPKEIAVGAPSKIKFQLIRPLGASGLYTQEEIGKVQKLLTFGMERKVVENIITRRVAGMEAGSQGYTTIGMFNPEEMKELAHSTIKQLWGWFSDLGIFMSGILGFYVIFRLIKYTFGVILNGFHLYQTVGGGIALLACLWNTLTMWVIHRHHQGSARVQKDSNQEKVELETVSERKDNAEKETTASVGNVYPSLSSTSHWTMKEPQV